MPRVRSGSREPRRIDNADSADSAGVLAPSRTGIEDTDVSGPILTMGAASPLAAGHQPPLPLAPLERVAQYQLWSIAELLTFIDVTSMTLTSKGLHLAIKAHPHLRLDEIPAAFERALEQLGCNVLLRNIRLAEAEISLLSNEGQPAARLEHEPESKHQPGAPMLTTGAPADSERAGVGLARQFRLALLRAAQAGHGKERARQAEAAEKHLRDIRAQKTLLTSKLKALEPGIEDIVFHFASLVQIPIADVADAVAAQTVAPERVRFSLHKAIEDGAVETVRPGLRKMLSLPPLLMPRERKLAWLQQQGASTLESSARRCCGILPPGERRHYEAITAFVDEIMSSAHLEPDGKRQLIKLDLVPFALRQSNPAFAASMLVGVHASSAAPDLKHSLLTSIAGSRDELVRLADSISGSLNRYAHLAPGWVARLVADLNSVVNDWPGSAQIPV